MGEGPEKKFRYFFRGGEPKKNGNSVSNFHTPPLSPSYIMNASLIILVHVENSQRVTIHLPQKRFSHNGI